MERPAGGCPDEVLEQAGLLVVVVNGKYVKKPPGCKTDMKDCPGQATLHAHGLLKPGGVPPTHSRRRQYLPCLQSNHIVLAGSREQHMQKALEQMSLKIHDVISDLTDRTAPVRRPGAGRTDVRPFRSLLRPSASVLPILPHLRGAPFHEPFWVALPGNPQGPG